MTDPGAKRTELEQAVKACRSAFFTVAVFSFCINLLLLTVPVYMIQVFDRVMSSRSEDTLLALTIAAFLAFAILGGLHLVRSRMLVRIGLWLDAKLGPALFSATLASGAGAAKRSMQAIRDVAQIRTFLTGAGIFAILDAPWVPLFIGLIFIMHPMLGLTALLGALLMIAIAYLNEVLTRAPLGLANTATLQSMVAGEIMIRQAEAAEGMGMGTTLSKWWSAQNARALDYQATASDRAGSLMAVSKFIRLGLQIFVLGLAALFVIREDLTVGGMLATSIMLARALAPVEQSIGVWRNLVSTRLALRRVRELFEQVGTRPPAMPLPRPEGKLVVSKVAYAVEDAQEPVFRDLSFAVNPGELLGITGPTGAGKSTLVRMLIGVTAPAKGTVRLDGADVFAWNSDDLGRHVGYVPQVVELLPGTIRDNIARFTEAPPEQVIEAAKRAGIHDLVLRFPEGYDTIVGGPSDMLSVGTRQRVALARALFGDPRLVVLDEPYSNLDNDGVQALTKALLDLKARRATTVIVAHRPSIMAHADRVLVIQNGAGRIMEKTRRSDLKVYTNTGPTAAPAQPTPPQPARVARPAADAGAVTASVPVAAVTPLMVSPVVAPPAADAEAAPQAAPASTADSAPAASSSPAKRKGRRARMRKAEAPVP